MQADPEHLRRHYSSLSDEALLDIDRSDLVEMAQQCYDAEIVRRGLPPAGSVRSANVPRVETQPDDGPDEDLETEEETFGTGDEPEWLDEAAEVYSVMVQTRGLKEDVVADASEILKAAGIPCYSELIELTGEEKAPVSATHRWRFLVPAQFNLRAIGILQRDIDNQDFEAGFRSQLEACSDSEISAMHPRTVFCGLFDRIDRATRAYEEEIARRGLKPESAR